MFLILTSIMHNISDDFHMKYTWFHRKTVKKCFCLKYVLRNILQTKCNDHKIYDCNDSRTVNYSTIGVNFSCGVLLKYF